jgi:hypothetical protein
VSGSSARPTGLRLLKDTWLVEWRVVSPLASLESPPRGNNMKTKRVYAAGIYQAKLPPPFSGCSQSPDLIKLASPEKKGSWLNREPPIGLPFIPAKKVHTRSVSAPPFLER